MEITGFYAGASKADITPTQDLLPMPLIFVIRFTKVLDPVYVRVLAMSDGRQQSLFIVFEMTLVPYAEETIKFVMKETGLPRENIFLAATHTHGTPPVSIGMYKENSHAEKKCRKWYVQIQAGLVKAIREAQENMAPARFGYGTGTSDINVCRDMVVGSGSKLGSNYDRPSDKTLWVVRIEDMAGKEIAMIVNYACHAVVMNGCLSGLHTPVTGDFPGRVCAKLEDMPERGIVIWCSGAAGDQNPKKMTQQGSVVKGKYRLKFLGKKGYQMLEQVAEEHSRDIIKTAAAVKCAQTDGGFYGAGKTVLVEAKEPGRPKVPYTLRLFMIGDIAFQGISAEIVTSVGKAVRETSPYAKTIFVSHACGYQGYVADDWEYDHNAFEVGNAKVAKGAAVREFAAGFAELIKTCQAAGRKPAKTDFTGSGESCSL